MQVRVTCGCVTLHVTLHLQPAEAQGERKRMVLNKGMQEWLETGANPLQP